MQVVKEHDGGVVRRVRLVNGDGELVTAACRFLDHLVDRGFSPHTTCAYAYDLRRLFTFLAAAWTGTSSGARTRCQMRARPTRRCTRRGSVIGQAFCRT
ncbi:site-specific integrase [Streptomyces sp. NPDC053720]|uniref:site-specific integrase n=1 Tax=Streptomyces sp. NPDC053720 TaxID=3154855 RepID=UPI00341E5381